MNSSFSNMWSFSYPDLKPQLHLFLLNFEFKLQNIRKQKAKRAAVIYVSLMLKYFTRTKQRTCNVEEPQQKYRTGTASNILQGLKHVKLDPN